MRNSADQTSCQTGGAETAAVWFTPTDAVSRPELVRDYERMLDDNERRRYESFHFPADRHLYLVAHALLRTSLSRCADVSPQDWRFSGEHGQRPEVVPSQAAASRLRFSLSHTRGLAACIITQDVDVGVDVEKLENRVNAMSIGERYFSAYESRQLAGLSSDARQQRFLEYWTLKEAYVKACGVGLSVPLDDFYFDRDGGDTWRINFSTESDSPPAAWQFWCGRPTPDHVMSIAIRRPGQRPFDVTIRETIPLAESPSSPACHCNDT